MEAFLVICCLVLFVMVLAYRSKQERQVDRERVRDLTTRIYFLGSSMKREDRVFNIQTLPRARQIDRWTAAASPKRRNPI